MARVISRILERNPDEMFLIEGHTDAVGDDEDNLTLSDRRAESVAVMLSEEFGVPPENLTTQGYGEQFLKIATDGPERLNRRVTVRRITPLLSRELQGVGPASGGPRASRATGRLRLDLAAVGAARELGGAAGGQDARLLDPALALDAPLEVEDLADPGDVGAGPVRRSARSSRCRAS